jgi:hypothetical protein
MIRVLKQEFTSRFQFRKREATLRYFSISVDVTVEHISDEFLL